MNERNYKYTIHEKRTGHLLIVIKYVTDVTPLNHLYLTQLLGF